VCARLLFTLDSLFYPGARLISSRRDDKGNITARLLTPEDYVSRGKDVFASQGFFETSAANRTEQWDHMAHVWRAPTSLATPRGISRSLAASTVFSSSLTGAARGYSPSTGKAKTPLTRFRRNTCTDIALAGLPLIELSCHLSFVICACPVQHSLCERV